MGRRLLGLALVAAISILTAACGSGSEGVASSNYVGVAPPSSNEEDAASGSITVGAAPGRDSSVTGDATALASLSDDERTELTGIFETYLALRSEAIIGAIAPDDLSGVATEQAITQVAQMRDDNTARIGEDNPSAVTSLMEWANLTDIEQNGEGLAFIDCTERQAVLLNGRTEVHFVTNAVEVVQSDGLWKVDRVEELQNGDYGLVDGEYGCVPPSFIGRAEAVTSSAIREAAAATGDPRGVLERGLIPEISGTAREDLELALSALDEANLRRTADEEVTMAIVGMDVNKPDYTVIVSVCRRYPNGRFYVDATTGDAQAPDIVAGGSEEEWLFIQLEPVASGSQTADAVVAVESQPTVHCQEG